MADNDENKPLSHLTAEEVAKMRGVPRKAAIDMWVQWESAALDLLHVLMDVYPEPEKANLDPRIGEATGRIIQLEEATLNYLGLDPDMDGRRN